ncbi:hypothetical protein [Methyloceanibacter stevinii]|uniref:hypothetical protein n=1 Tax=Methyloceanibacter stevinii TaxID=1774970 RepID=UPI00114CADFC|nr:hypothetical protein [Methyloceanibacter stevinii]
MRDPEPDTKITKAGSKLSAPPKVARERDPEGQTTVPAKRRRLQFTLGLIIMVLSLCAGLATYLVLTGLTPIVPTQQVVVTTLLINAVLVVACWG